MRSERDREVALLECIIAKVKLNELTREAVAHCYYSTQPPSSTEKKSTSEIWINVIYDNVSQIERQELFDAQHSRAKMGEILLRIMP